VHISRVLIRNFRNFKDLEIDPFPRHAVVVGENGVGKSNLLHALRLVLDPDLPESARVLRPEDICDQADATLADGVEVRVEIELTGFTGDLAAEAVLSDCLVALEPLTARLSYVFRPGSAIEENSHELTVDDYDWEILGGLADSGVDARRIRHDIRLSVLPALRDASRDLSRWRDSPLHELLEARPPAPGALQAAAATIQKAMDDLSDDDQITEIADDLSQRLKDLAGYQMNVEPTLGFASSNPDLLLRSTQLFIDANRVRSVSDTSTGYANVIYLGLLLERLASRRKKDTILDSELAVEEPEAHLHPVLQRQLFRSLLRGETALTVTTHSPHIAAVSPLDSLVLLRATPAAGTVAATTAKAQLTVAQVADLERYLDVSRAELLFCRAAVLVEGPSEAYLLPALARVLGFNLDAHGVIVADVSGTDFAPYRTLLGTDALGVAHVVVTDGDPVSRVNGQEKYVYAGLRRAARLIDDPNAAAMPVGTLVASLVEAGEGEDPTEGRLLAARQNVFVGLRTLELDMAPLLSDQMIRAYEELSPGPRSLKGFTTAIKDITDGKMDAATREGVLDRIERIGKGRFAQRLAAHVDAMDRAALRGSIVAAAGLDAGDPATPNIGRDELLVAGSFGYIFAALEAISRTVRSKGLLLARSRRTVRRRAQP
jgi:putative ATP-dependent endonuclease of OLD family